MKYLVSAIHYAARNWMLMLPVFVLTAIVNIIAGVSSAINSGIWSSLSGMNDYTDFKTVFTALSAIFAAVVGSAVLALIARLIYEPATYGLVNKSLETGNAGLNDIGAAISGNFIKFVIYLVGMLVVGLVASVAALLVWLLLKLIFSLLGALGAVIMVILTIAIILFFIALFIVLSFWFSAMVVDSLDVVAAAKKSIEVVKSCFWTILGVWLLVLIVCAVASGILYFVTKIPLLGPIIYSVVPTVQYFVMAVFFLLIYREKTGRTNTGI